MTSHASAMHTKHDTPRFAPDSPAAVDCDSIVLPTARPARDRRAVHFSTATTFVFPLTYGGSALPKEAGPPIGMTMDHDDVYVTDLSTAPHRRSCVRKFQHLERINLLKAAGIDPSDIAAYCAEAIATRTSRANTVRQLKRGLSCDQDVQEDARTTSPSAATFVQHKRRRMYAPVESKLD